MELDVLLQLPIIHTHQEKLHVLMARSEWANLTCVENKTKIQVKRGHTHSFLPLSSSDTVWYLSREYVIARIFMSSSLYFSSSSL